MGKIGPSMDGVHHSFYEITRYLNLTNNIDKFDANFTQNIFEKIIYILLKNVLPTDAHSEVQGRIHIMLSSSVHWLYNEGGGEDVRDAKIPEIYTYLYVYIYI